MGVRIWISGLYLAVSILSIPSYGQSENKNRLIVRFKEGVNYFGEDLIYRSLGVKTASKLDQLGNVEVVELPENISLEDGRRLYAKNNQVLYVESDFTIRVNPRKDGNHYKQQWALNNTGQKVGKSVGKEDADINAPEAWEYTQGDKKVYLGVIDTGIFYKHPDLIPNIWENPGEIPGNGIDDDEDGFVDDIYGINAMDHTGDPLDDNGHGTHVSGIMAGSGVDGGVLGINQKSNVIGCKFLNSEGDGRMSDALICMDYFVKLKTRKKNPVEIVAVNASWGSRLYSKAMYDAINEMRKVEILFVAAAGNDGEDNDKVNSFPANYKLSNIISVAATNNKDELAYFSNYGRHSVHVGAPGVDILSTVLDGKYESYSGTSMATPYVTGLIGLLKAQDPSLDWKKLKNLVIAGGTKLESLGKKTVSGRRIRAADVDGKGSLTCSNQKANSRMLPEKSEIFVKNGNSVDFSVLKIECGEPDVAPHMALNMGYPAEFSDEDDIGVYTATWKPDALGTYDIDLGDGDKVSVKVVEKDSDIPAPKPRPVWPPWESSIK